MKAISLLVLVITLVSYSCSQTAPTFPNIGYLGSGYDYMQGNPHTTVTTEAPDPGYRQWVFNLTTYSGNNLTPDQRYRIPDGTQVEMCDACSVDWTTKNISGSQSYQHTLDDSISANIGIFVAHFSGSYDYKTVQEHTSSYSDVYTETAAECCVYKAQLETFNGPGLSNDFIAGVSQMPTTYSPSNQAFWQEFFGAFGTHYTSLVTMGGRFGQRSRITSSSWSKLSSSDLTISVSAGFSAQSFSAAVTAMTEDDKSQAQAYSSLTESQSLFSIGGQLPSDFTVQSWIDTSKDDPMPLQAQIHPITKVLNNLYFPNDPKITQKNSAMTAALLDYCHQLLLQNITTSCNAPPPSPPLPPPSLFGGMYQQDECNKDNVNNAYTSSMNCRNGYTPALVGRYLSPDSGCKTHQYLCMLAGMTEDPLKSFGGLFQVEGSYDKYNNDWDIVNPVTGELSCPTGYTKMEVGRVLIALNNNYAFGAYQYGCWNMSSNLQKTTSAGRYQRIDHNDAHDNVMNPWTQATSCPSGFTAYEVGRVVGPDTQNLAGAYQFVCLNNVFMANSTATSK